VIQVCELLKRVIWMKSSLIFILLIVSVIPAIACGNGEAILATPTSTSTPTLLSQMLDDMDTLSPSFAWDQPAKIETFNVTPIQYELDYEYALKRGELVTPPPGAAFLWVFVTVDDISDNANDPLFIFELYYRGESIHDTTIGHVDNEPINRPSFRSGKLYPDQRREGWILFEVPKAIDLSDAYFLVRPLSSPADFTAWQLASD
jgi:hypothetical protein